MFEAVKGSLRFPVSTGPFRGGCICPVCKLLGEYSMVLEVNHHLPKDVQVTEQCTGLGEDEQMCCWLRSYPCSTRQENYWLWFIVGHRKHRHIFPGTKLDSCTCGWEPQASSDLNAGVCFQKKVVFHHKSNFFQLFWLRHCQTLKHYLPPPKLCSSNL